MEVRVMAARALKSRGSGKSIEGMFLYISVSDMPV